MEPSQNASNEHEVILDAQFFPLIPVSVFVPGPHCLDCYSSVVSEVGSTKLLALFIKIALNPLHVYVHFEISLSTFIKKKPVVIKSILHFGELLLPFCMWMCVVCLHVYMCG